MVFLNSSHHEAQKRNGTQNIRGKTHIGFLSICCKTFSTGLLAFVVFWISPGSKTPQKAHEKIRLFLQWVVGWVLDLVGVWGGGGGRARFCFGAAPRARAPANNKTKTKPDARTPTYIPTFAWGLFGVFCADFVDGLGFW
jgi:hypothetical protein